MAPGSHPASGLANLPGQLSVGLLVAGDLTALAGEQVAATAGTVSTRN